MLVTLSWGKIEIGQSVLHFEIECRDLGDFFSSFWLADAGNGTSDHDRHRRWERHSGPHHLSRCQREQKPLTAETQRTAQSSPRDSNWVTYSSATSFGISVRFRYKKRLQSPRPCPRGPATQIRRSKRET